MFKTSEGEAGGVVRALGSWESTVTVTDVKDIGRVVVKLVTGEKDGGRKKVWDDVKDSVVYLAGDTVTYGQVADMLGNAMERKVRAALKREVWDVEILKTQLRKNPDDPIFKYRVVFAEGKGVARDKKHTFNSTEVITVQSVKEWIERNI